MPDPDSSAPLDLAVDDTDTPGNLSRDPSPRDPSGDAPPESVSSEPLSSEPAASEPVLPEAVRRHLGAVLGLTYDRLGPVFPDRFAELLARLDAALTQAADGREAAFRAGLLEVVPALHRFAVSLARDPAAADDLVQDTLLRGWRSRDGFQPGTNLEAWLFTILRNVFYSAHRKHGREVSDSDGNHAERLASAPEQGGHVDLQDVRAALGRLAPVMREALVLVAIEDLSYEEAAAVMGCRIGTVKSRVWRAREQLTRLLGYDGAGIGSDGVTLSVTGTPA